MKMTREILRATQGAPSGFANSRSPASPTPSAQRTGVPTARSRSSTTTSSSGAARFAQAAATQPAGPAPTIKMSTSGIDHGERADRTRRDALATAGASPAVYHQVVEFEVDRFGRAQGQAQAAAVARGQVDHGDFSGTGATHGRTVAAPVRGVKHQP